MGDSQSLFHACLLRSWCTLQIKVNKDSPCDERSCTLLPQLACPTRNEMTTPTNKSSNRAASFDVEKEHPIHEETVEQLAATGVVATDAYGTVYTKCTIILTSGGQPIVHFDPKAERRLVRKLDLFTVPTVSLLYLFCFIDVGVHVDHLGCFDTLLSAPMSETRVSQTSKGTSGSPVSSSTPCYPSSTSRTFFLKSQATLPASTLGPVVGYH